MNEKIKILAVVGPTASGKSSLALELAKRHGGEIISCDSMQVYRRMNIGTAKPSEAEQAEVRHHMIDIVEPWEPFSCEDYARIAATAIEACAARGHLPIICGGTGLYLDTLLRGGNSAPACENTGLREELNARAEKEGVQVLYEELCRVDPESAVAIHPNNIKRVIRALEIYLSCGIPKSELDRRSRELDFKYDANALWLNYSDREQLYGRIDRRVEQMLLEGLVEETKALISEGVFEFNQTAAQAIGYKELFGYIEGREGLETATETLKRATRRYAKRQITWFSAKDYINSLSIGSEETFEKIVNNAEKVFSL